MSPSWFFTEQVESRESLRENEERLSEQNIKLQRKTIALGEVLEQVETEKNRLKEKVNTNLQAVLLPLVARLKTVRPEQVHKYLNMLEDSLKDILTSFGPALSDQEYGLTQREREVCSLVKNGLTSKEIAKLMDISCRTVDRHRENIRRKFGISGSKTSLIDILQQLSE